MRSTISHQLYLQMQQKTENPRIVFMGTPDFAVATLDALLENGYSIVAAVTAPDKPAGRGMKLSEAAVKQYAVKQGIPVLQPVNLKDPEFIQELTDFQADIQVVVAFRMLPEIVWGMPPQGTINLHGSLLPQYRGAAPINRAIMNGETETGVTTFKLQHEIDTGDILLQESFPIGDDETAGAEEVPHRDARSCGNGLNLAVSIFFNPGFRFGIRGFLFSILETPVSALRQLAPHSSLRAPHCPLGIACNGFPLTAF